MACSTEGISLPTILGCPGNDELFFVANAVGGQEPGGYGWRKWKDLKNCIVVGTVPPYVGIVDRGQIAPTKDPVSNTSILQDDSLIGLGATNNGNIQMVIASQLLTNYGDEAFFTYDPITGTIDISPSIFVAGNAVSVDRNQ